MSCQQILLNNPVPNPKFYCKIKTINISPMKIKMISMTTLTAITSFSHLY